MRHLTMLACILLPGIATSVRAEETCSADPKWLNAVAPLPVFAEPAPKRHDEKGGDCPFYQAAWQVFLYATQPVAGPDGKTLPLFLVRDFSTIEETFGAKFAGNFPLKSEKFANELSLAPKSLQRANSSDPKSHPRIGAGVNQAGSLAPVIDRNGNPLFYAIHMNDTIKNFFTNNHLLTRAGLKKAEQDPGFKNLEFPPGSIELKSAWQIVIDSSTPDNYFVTKAFVPWLKTDNQGNLFADPSKKDDPREVTVALVALHVAFVLQDHPEFIWSTFEHVDSAGNPDTAPSAAHNPTKPPTPIGLIPTTPPVTDYLLFKAGSPLADANVVPKPTPDILANFDETKQSFTKTGRVFQTSVYRVYRASKADDKEGIDPEILAVSKRMADDVFKPGSINTTLDKRDRYRLVGAVWMDDPSVLSPK